MLPELVECVGEFSVGFADRQHRHQRQEGGHRALDVGHRRHQRDQGEPDDECPARREGGPVPGPAIAGPQIRPPHESAERDEEGRPDRGDHGLRDGRDGAARTSWAAFDGRARWDAARLRSPAGRNIRHVLVFGGVAPGLLATILARSGGA
ncbi:hypothetical protein GCM10023094_50000 [Rhodococcus olei]|uniref:Uncharacterized protein n=1 Tax=Rhodococcus olei TaxID=2161675 RepID=A0ABP8PP10_9NOCA